MNSETKNLPPTIKSRQVSYSDYMSNQFEEVDEGDNLIYSVKKDLIKDYNFETSKKKV